MDIGIVGAGLLGRLLAWRLLQNDCQVTVFDENTASGKGSATYSAGGMISPLAEQEKADSFIYELGNKSLPYWEAWLPELKQDVFFQKKGSILVAHMEDISQLHHLADRIKKSVASDSLHAIDRSTIKKMEPELDFQQAYFLQNEAQIDARALLDALATQLILQGATLHFTTKVTQIFPKKVKIKNNTFTFDWVFDCRGICAQDTFANLRGVRGELVYLHAPLVHLNHVIRFLHPRYRLYIIPRPEKRYLLGSTEIDSVDTSPISVRSALELLSAAYSVHRGFAEARILETITAVRAAFPDNLPHLYYQPGLMAINGLYRHGFLIAPSLVNEAITILYHGLKSLHYPHLIKEFAEYDKNYN